MVKPFELRVEENARTAIEKYWKNGFVPGISPDEVKGLAAKLKRQELIKEGKMSVIEKEAEDYFRRELFQRDLNLYKIYVSLKSGEIEEEEDKKAWEDITSLLNDRKIKEDYIRSRIEPSTNLDRELFNEAIERIIRKRTEISFAKYEKYTKGKKLPQDQGQNFIGLAELLRGEANDIMYERRLHDSIVDAILEKKNTYLLYCICLRLTHDFGIPNITPHLEPFYKTDKDGQKQFHSGEAQRYQLEKIVEISEEINRLFPEINQRIMVADFDAYKYGESVARRIVQKTREYINAVSQLVKDVEVIGEMEYMNQIGFDQNLYNRIFESIIENDGQFFPTRDINRELKNCHFYRSRSINNWNEEMNRYYVAASTSRKLAEGVALSQSRNDHVVFIFNNNAVAGTRFNYLVKRKIPFVSLPKLGRPVDSPIFW